MNETIIHKLLSMNLQEINIGCNSITIENLIIFTWLADTVFMTVYVLIMLTQFFLRKNIFECNIVALTIFTVATNVAFITIVIKPAQLYVYMEQFIKLMYMLYMLILYIIFKILIFIERRIKNIYTVSSMQGLDYGTGMAYSYYYGYLKLILPSPGTVSKGFIERIENVEDIHGIKVAIHKLLILIPSSSYIPHDLKESSYQWMESAIMLEPDVRDRAGVKKRSYHNNIYKIYPNGKRAYSTPVYVVVEGATPLLTFYEAQKHAHPESDIYRRHSKSITKHFCTKLKELLQNDPDCADLCELIYYDDYDSYGVKVNIAKVILEHLKLN